MCGVEPARKAVRTADERQTAVCRFASTRTSQGRAPAQPSHSDQNKKHHFCGVFCFARMCGVEPARKAVRTADERQTAVCRFASTRTSQGRAPAQPSHSDQNKKHHFCGVFCFTRIYYLCSIIYALIKNGANAPFFISLFSIPNWRLFRQSQNCC